MSESIVINVHYPDRDAILSALHALGSFPCAVVTDFAPLGIGYVSCGYAPRLGRRARRRLRIKAGIAERHRERWGR